MRKALDSKPIAIVLSGDYGDLGMAQYFVAGQDFAGSTVFVAPPKLHNSVVSLQQEVRIYAHVDDIVDIVTEIDPRVVLLFSGYLLTADRLFALSPFIPSLSSLERLIDRLESSGCIVVTNDPFCGLAGHLRPWNLRFASGGLYARSWRERLLAPIRSLIVSAYCRRVQRVVGKLPHLYAGRGPARLDRRNIVAFFNAEARQHHIEAAANARGATYGKPDAKPTWLFILSEIDLIVQQNLLGDRLVTQVAARLTDAWRCRRTPILIAPGRFLRNVREELHPQTPGALMDVVPYGRFIRELMNCEFAFYWNVFSFSTLLRLINGRPVFCFDKGHLSRLIKPFYDVAIDCYFDGNEPTFLDANEALQLAHLNAQAERFAQFAERVVPVLESCSSPADVINTLVAGSTAGYPRGRASAPMANAS